MRKLNVFFVLCFCLLSIVFGASCSSENSLAKDYEVNKQSQPAFNLQETSLVTLTPSYKFGEFSFYDLSILENGTIWAVGFDGKNHGSLRVSKDGGKTWDIKIISQEFTTLDSIDFVDNLHGWVSGFGNVFMTSNGGENWRNTNLNTYLDSTIIDFHNLRSGYVIGKHNIKGEESSEIWITNDGGETWRKSYENKELTNPFSILAVSENTALAILDEKNLIKTTDSGKNWQIIESFNHPTDKLYMDKNGQIWALGRNGSFFYSSDYGETWNRPRSFPKSLESESWNSISFLDQQVGLAVGDNRAIAVTKDSGITWKIIEDTNENLLKVYFNNKMGLIIGSDNLYAIKKD